MSKPEPLWMKLNRRPSWQRNDPIRYSDVNPAAPVVIAANRLRAVIDRRTARMVDMLDRLDALERARAARAAARRTRP